MLIVNIKLIRHRHRRRELSRPPSALASHRGALASRRGAKQRQEHHRHSRRCSPRLTRVGSRGGGRCTAQQQGLGRVDSSKWQRPAPAERGRRSETGSWDRSQGSPPSDRTRRRGAHPRSRAGQGTGAKVWCRGTGMSPWRGAPFCFLRGQGRIPSAAA